MHLEQGNLPLRYVMKQDKGELIFKIVEVQFSDPKKGDWVVQAKQDLTGVDLDITFEQICIMSGYTY